jgi:hypothetical protein
MMTMNHTDAAANVWANHLRHRAEVPVAYGQPEDVMLLAIPDRGLRPLAAAIESHRRLLRLATDDRRLRSRTGPGPSRLADYRSRPWCPE